MQTMIKKQLGYDEGLAQRDSKYRKANGPLSEELARTATPEHLKTVLGNLTTGELDTLFALKDFKGAVRDFKRCIELDPSREKKVQTLIDEAQKHADTRKA